MKDCKYVFNPVVYRNAMASYMRVINCLNADNKTHTPYTDVDLFMQDLEKCISRQVSFQQWCDRNGIKLVDKIEAENE